jgi:hypothetical protein
MRRKRRQRRPLGHLTPEQLLVHRELEFLRVAGEKRPRAASERRRHAYHIRQRGWKLEQARRITAAA